MIIMLFDDDDNDDENTDNKYDDWNNRNYNGSTAIDNHDINDKNDDYSNDYFDYEDNNVQARCCFQFLLEEVTENRDIQYMFIVYEMTVYILLKRQFIPNVAFQSTHIPLSSDCNYILFNI